MSIRNGLIFLFLMLSAVQSSVAKEANKTFLVGVENLDYYPILRFAGRTPEGFLMALLDEVTKDSDISYELLPLPVARLKKELAVGNIDVQFPDNPSWNYDFQQPKVFSRPVVRYKDAFFALLPHTKINTVAAPLGFTVPEATQEFSRFTYLSSIEGLFTLLSNNRIDAIYLNQLVAKNFAQKQQLIIYERDDYPADKQDFYFSAINESVLLDRVNRFMTTKPNRYRALLETYGLQSSAQ